MSVPLGPVEQLTKPEAKRRLREVLQQPGVNTEAHLLQAIKASKTFKQESEWWKENKLSPMRTDLVHSFEASDIA